MRTKANARFIAKVVDLTQPDQLLPTTLEGPSKTTQITKVISMNVNHAQSVTNVAGRIHKVCTKKHKSAGKTPSLKRSNRAVIGLAGGPVQAPFSQSIGPSGGLYRFDLTQLITQKLRALHERQQSMQNMHGSNNGTNFVSYDHLQHSWINGQQKTMGAAFGSSSFVGTGPRVANILGGGGTRHCCSVPGCKREAVLLPTSIRIGLSSVAQQAYGRRFSIFHSVELMAQSSTIPRFN